MRLAEKVAVITGGGSGFGRAMVERFVREGGKVVLVDSNDGLARQLAGQFPGRVKSVIGDVTDRENVRAMLVACEEFGGPDILINNAGYTHLNCPMLEVSEEEFDRVFAVNVKAIYLAALEFVPVFRARGGGVILNVASTAGLRPRPGLTWYNGSKGAAVTLSKSMAVELAPDRIRVNAICPVAGDTPMLVRFMGGDDTPELRERFVSTIPIGRMSSPEDVASAAVYLASDDASFITGVALEVDGGRCV